MMLTKGKSDFTKVDSDNQVLVQMKLFGVTLDKKLNFSDHVSYTCRNTSKRIRFFMRLRKLISTTIKLHIYKAAFVPYFHDGSLVWHFKSSDRNKLERMNERGLSAVFCDENSTYKQILIKYNLTTLYNMRLEFFTFHLMKIFLTLCS